MARQAKTSTRKSSRSECGRECGKNTKCTKNSRTSSTKSCN